MARTMKALDGRLAQLEQLANTLERRGWRDRKAPGDEPAPEDLSEPD